MSCSVPSIVYGVTRFSYTSDSFVALPTECLGQNYVVASMDDMSALYGGYTLPSETSVVGVYDSTLVTVTIGGPTITKTAGGLLSGDKTTFMINRGDVWLMGNAATAPGSDLTGTHIVADKPVAVFSGNQCANVPINIRWCDFIDEQEVPVESWGYHYPIPRYATRTGGFYERVFAGKPSTMLNRNGQYWKTLSTVGGKENEGWSYERVSPNNSLVSISSENPIRCVVYNPGQEDDNISTDPFQMNVIPWEQFIDSCIFCTPGTKGGIAFTRNYMGVIFPVDGNGEVPSNLEFARAIGDSLVWAPLRTVFGPTVATKDIYNDTMPNGKVYAYKEYSLPGDNVYAVRCPDPIMIYSYGGSDYDSYGHPAGSLALSLNSKTDNKSPGIELKSSGGTISGTAHDFPDDPAVRSNLSKVVLMPSSTNCRLIAPRTVDNGTSTVNFNVEIVDKNKDAKAVISVSDKAGNGSSYTYTYVGGSYLAPRISSSTGSSICLGTLASLSCSGDFASYLWSTGETASSIEVLPNTVGSYKYWVMATNSSGSQLMSDTFELNVLALPAKPSVTQNGNVLHASEATSYQWYLNGTAISGATNAEVVLDADGQYTVRVSNENGCSITSDPVNFVNTVQDESERNGISLLPNPVKGNSMLRYTLRQPTSIQIFDARGLKLRSYSGTDIPQGQMELSLGSLNAGVYTLQLHDAMGVHTVTFVRE